MKSFNLIILVLASALSAHSQAITVTNTSTETNVFVTDNHKEVWDETQVSYATNHITDTNQVTGVITIYPRISQSHKVVRHEAEEATERTNTSIVSTVENGFITWGDEQSPIVHTTPISTNIVVEKRLWQEK